MLYGLEIRTYHRFTSLEGKVIILGQNHHIFNKNKKSSVKGKILAFCNFLTTIWLDNTHREISIKEGIVNENSLDETYTIL